MNAGRALWFFLVVPGLVCAFAMPARGQETPPGQAKPSETASSTNTDLPAAPKPRPEMSPEFTHRFWDKKNAPLFAGVGVSRTLDYFSTLNMRRRGRQEILLTNDVVDNHAAFAVIEAAAAGVSIGASYLLHRYGHHRLERWASIVHVSIATSGAIRNYSLKTAHPASAPP